MPTYFVKPENALKRAGEFSEVGKPKEALDVLYDVIKSKRHRTWQKTHEPIMNRYLDLCVELKHSHFAKEGLYQYKNICQQVNVKSLDMVIRRYLETADRRTEEAREKSHSKSSAILDVEDLDVIQTPESLLLATVSGEDDQDRSDRVILTPWVKFLWESYRLCLDLLRNNNRVERLYHDIAKQAFDFCLKYTRKTEFRKLCDNLRNHVRYATEKTHTQQNAISLNNPDTLSMHLETRLAQLDSAIQMELWQEAFKAVEDIHDLIARSKKIPRPSLLANYYEKFGLVFWKAGNNLFHAAACHKLFILITEQKKSPSQQEVVRMANRVLCSTLSIPLPPTRQSIDQLLESNEAEKRRRLASLLSLPAPPTRVSLVKDLVKNNILQHVSPELKTLYSNLEVEFDPLNLSAKVTKCMDFIMQQSELQQYGDPVQEITVIRLIKQVAQIYQTIELARLHQLAPFVTMFKLERMMVQAAKNIDLPVRLDHQSRTVSFGTDVNVCLQDDTPEGPFLQHMPGEQIRNQLQYMAQALHKAMDKLQLSESTLMEKQKIKIKIMETYMKTEKRDREKVLKRKSVIENRKEELEIISQQRDEVEQRREYERQKKIREAEEARLKREAAEREKQRAQQEHQDIRRKEAEKRIEQLKTTDIGIRALEGLTENEIAELDTDDILQKQVQQLEKEKKELSERLKAQEKKIDHFVRAKHLEEIPLLIENAKTVAAENRRKWDQQEADRIASLKKEREIALQHRDRLARILPDRDCFLDSLKEARHGAYMEKLAEYEKMSDKVRKERLAERRAARKEERRQKAMRAREDRKQRERDEAIRREREEKIQREREEQEARQKAEQEKLAKLEAIAEKQKLKELEVEEKLRNQRQEIQPRAVGWREREAEKQDRWMKTDDREKPIRDSADQWQRGGDRRDERFMDDGRRGGESDRWRGGSSRDDKRDFRDDRKDFSSDRRDFRDDRKDLKDDRSLGSDWRSGGSRDDRKDDRRDYGREDRRDYGREDRWQRGGDSEHRRGEFRRDDRDFRRDGDRWGRSDDGGGSWRTGDTDKKGPPPRDDFRRGPPRDDDFRRGPPRDDGFRRGPPREDDFRRGPPRDDDFRRGGPPRDSGLRSDDVWRRGEALPAKKVDHHAAAVKQEEKPENTEWNTVRYKQ